MIKHHFVAWASQLKSFQTNSTIEIISAIRGREELP